MAELLGPPHKVPSWLPSAAKGSLPVVASVLEELIGDVESASMNIEVGEEFVVVVEVSFDESAVVPVFAFQPVLKSLSWRSFKPGQLLATAPRSASEAKTSARTSTTSALMMIDIAVPPFSFVLKITASYSDG